MPEGSSGRGGDGHGGEGGNRCRGEGSSGRGGDGRGHLLHQPVAQEPHGGPHATGRQVAGQHPPQIGAGHPAPQPFDGLPDESARLGNAEVQLAMGVPQGQQHPLGFGELDGLGSLGGIGGNGGLDGIAGFISPARWGCFTRSRPIRRIGRTDEHRDRFGGWAGRVLLPFFVHR